MAPCRATQRCRLGGATRHHSAEFVKTISENTYTPVNKLTAKDIADYQSQKPVPVFKGMPPGTDITDSATYPVIDNKYEQGLFNRKRRVHKTVIVDEDKMIIFTESGNGQRSDYTGWLVQSHSDGFTPIGMIRARHRHQGDLTSPDLTLMSVEVRPEYRGKGFSRKLAQGVELAFETPALTNGHYTPEGAQALPGVFPLKEDPSDNEQGTVTFESMNFVSDWEGFDLF